MRSVGGICGAMGRMGRMCRMVPVLAFAWGGAALGALHKENAGGSPAPAVVAARADKGDPEALPIVVPAVSATDGGIGKREEDWYDRNMVRPFIGHLPDDKPWKIAARAYIKEAVTAWQTQRDFKDPVADGKHLIAQGCDDPLIAFLVQ